MSFAFVKRRQREQRACSVIRLGHFSNSLITSHQLMLGAVAGAGMLSIATAFNVIADNAGCSVAWTVVGAVLTFAFSSLRELGKVGWLGFVGFVSIMTAVVTLTIAVGVQDRPSSAPHVGPWDPQVIIVGNPSFLNAMTAVSTIICTCLSRRKSLEEPADPLYHLSLLRRRAQLFQHHFGNAPT